MFGLIADQPSSETARKDPDTNFVQPLGRLTPLIIGTRPFCHFARHAQPRHAQKTPPVLLWSTVACIRSSDPITLFCQYKQSTSPLFSRSPCSKGPHLKASLQLVTRLSKVTRIKPNCRGALHAWEPMYLVPSLLRPFFHPFLIYL